MNGCVILGASRSESKARRGLLWVAIGGESKAGHWPWYCRIERTPEFCFERVTRDSTLRLLSGRNAKGGGNEAHQKAGGRAGRHGGEEPTTAAARACFTAPAGPGRPAPNFFSPFMSQAHGNTRVNSTINCGAGKLFQMCELGGLTRKRTRCESGVLRVRLSCAAGGPPADGATGAAVSSSAYGMLCRRPLRDC